MTATKLAFSSLPAPAMATPNFLVGPEADALEQAVTNKIRERAQRLFEQSGGAPGNDEANWVQAESEILRANVEVRESGTWLSLRTSIPETSGQGIQIAVKPKRVLVRSTQIRNEHSSKQDGDEIFVVANLLVEVDPASAAASFRNHDLLLMIKKAQRSNALAI
jgi:HSP20 family molecular chaperone IbpA